MKKNILIISYSNLNKDPRVLRQIDFLGEDYNVTTAGLQKSGHKNEDDFIKISLHTNYTFHHNYSIFFRKLISLSYVLPIYAYYTVLDYISFKTLKKYNFYYWNHERQKTLKKLSKTKYHLIIANDIDTLPLAVKLKEQTGAKIYFDAHEYSPLEYDNDENWLKHRSPYYTFLCKTYIPFTDYCTTVAHKIAEKYEELVGKPFDVVYNSPQYQNLPASTNTGVIRCVHHGVASPIRKIESMINAFIALGNGFELNLLLMINDQKYFKELLELSKGHSNIIFHEPVATKDISSFINQYDISLIFIPPVNFNYRYCLPNKFFESIQARLMLLCGPSAEMEYLIDKYELGTIGTGFEADDIKISLENVTRDDIAKYKNNSNKVAELLAAETIMKNLSNKIHTICAE